jgi:predicted secreted Zn-dependent protease
VLQQKILIGITTELPRWEPGRAVAESLQASWDQSLARLVRHEAGHRENVLEAAAGLQETLASLESEVHCLSAQVNIDIALENALNRLDRREALYDRSTGNGRRDPPGPDGLQQAGTAEEQDAKLEKLRRFRTSRFPAE